MLVKFVRRQESVVSNWNEDARVVKVRERLAELAVLIPKAADRVKNELAPRVDEMEKQLRRMELEVLAGRAGDADLAAAQSKALDAKVAHAKQVLFVEDMEVEKRDLAENKLPAAEKKARAVSHAALRKQAVVLLKEMQAALQTMCQCEAELALIHNEADKQFSRDINQDKLRTSDNYGRNVQMLANPRFDPDCEPSAGIPRISSRNAAATLAEVNEALARLEGASSKLAHGVL